MNKNYKVYVIEGTESFDYYISKMNELYFITKCRKGEDDEKIMYEYFSKERVEEYLHEIVDELDQNEAELMEDTLDVIEDSAGYNGEWEFIHVSKADIEEDIIESLVESVGGTVKEVEINTIEELDAFLEEVAQC